MEFENAVDMTEAETVEEVAEPLEESQMEGSNESELAEQTSEVVAEPQDSSTNKAFQEMRHRNKELEDEIARLKAESEARATAFSRIAGEDADEISVLAEATGMSVDEVLNEFNSAKESYEKDARIEYLENQLDNANAERAMVEDLATIRKIDPTVKSLDELGGDFVRYISMVDPETGERMTAEQAYFAVKAKENAFKAKPAQEIGMVTKTPPEKEYFTEAEIEAMSSEELSRNWKKILKSWDR